MFKLFSIAGYSEKEVIEQFKWDDKCLSYGAPPHGGKAPESTE